MLNRKNFSFIICLLTGILLIFPTQVLAETFTIGVVKDGNSYFDEIIPLVKEELNKHLEDSQNIQFKHSDAFNANWKKN